MISCKEVASLISRRSTGHLPWWRVDARFHVLMCRSCRRFARQMQQIGLVSTVCRDALEPEGDAGEFEARVLKHLIEK
jgi:hypothetical protein